MSQKRIWNTNELIIAYYIAKWGYAGLKITEEDFVEYIIGNTTIPSLRMQVANFRFLLGIKGYQLEHASKAMKDIVDELANLTVTQVRRVIAAYVKECDETIQINERISHNKKVNKKRDELNAQYEANFQAKLQALRRYRNLRPATV